MLIRFRVTLRVSEDEEKEVEEKISTVIEKTVEFIELEFKNSRIHSPVTVTIEHRDSLEEEKPNHAINT